MKIIDKKVWWEFVCETCGSTCQADPEDVTSRPQLDHDSDEVGLIPTVECGACGKSHDVPAEKITGKVEGIIRNKRR